MHIVPYAYVLQTLQAQGLIPLYPNGGAFGWPSTLTPRFAGWIGPADGTIRPDMLGIAERIDPPYASNLARRLIVTCTEHLPGDVWLMPQAHWHFELHDSAQSWLPGLLRQIGIDPSHLETSNHADAVCFSPGDLPLLELAVSVLLEHLQLSDFWLAFPGRNVTALLHHHQQIWWMSDPASDFILSNNDEIPRSTRASDH